MFCGDSNSTAIEGKGVSLCYRSLVYLGLPALFALGGFCFSQLQEMKIRKKRTLFPLYLAVRCVGIVDWIRLMMFVLTGMAPLVLYVMEHDRYEDDVDGWPSHRHVDFLVFGIFPWILLGCSWLLHEIRRGSKEWFWLRFFTVIMVVGESLRFWSEMRNLDHDFNDPDHKDYMVYSGVIVLSLKVLSMFFMTCFNRDWRQLRVKLRSLGSESGLRESLISVRNESFVDGSGTIDEVDGGEVGYQESQPGGFTPQLHSEKLDRTPEQYAGLLSRLCFFWLEPLMLKGYYKPLEDTDFYKLLREDETQTLSRGFSDAFKQAKLEKEVKDRRAHARVAIDDHDEQVPYTRLEQQDETEQEQTEQGQQGGDEGNNNGNNKKAAPKLVEGSLGTIVRALHRSGVLRPFYQAAFHKLVYDTLLFVGPQILKELITYLQSDDDKVWKGYMYTGLMFATSLLQTFVLHIYFHKTFRTGMRVRSTLITAIYRKSLRLSPSARQERTTGEIVNLMSTDCERLNSLFPYLHVTWSSPYQVALAMYFLWAELQYAVLVAVGVIFIFMTPLTAFVAGRIKTIQKKLMKVKDERIRVTGEVITSIKVIKLYGWESTFRKMVEGAREDEIALLKTYVQWRAAARTLWTTTPILVTLATFAAFVLGGGELTAATAFTSLSLLNILRFPLAVLPTIFNSLIEASVSLRRIASFLYAEEVDFAKIDDVRVHTEIPLGSTVFVKNANFFWDDGLQVQALADINLDVKEGETCVVTGEVGSGKSALLYALVGELQLAKASSSGPPQLGLDGKVSYAAQVAWIQNASVRDNILFGCPYDREWYHRVVYACSLVPDFELLPDGDQTEIGERGINLSGGQKARVALARAVYSRADILFLETCFEAVDEHVGAHLWNECFQGLLKEPNPLTGRKRTVLVVTHALKYVHDADHIIVMKNGRIAEQGTYDSITAVPNSELSRLSIRVEQRMKKTTKSEKKTEDESKGQEVDGEKREALKRKMSSFRKDKGKGGAGGDLTGKEERGVGDVGWKVFQQYVQAVGGTLPAMGVLIGFVIRSLLDVLTSAWLAYWSAHSKSDDDDDVENTMRFPHRDLLGEMFYYGNEYGRQLIHNGSYPLLRDDDSTHHSTGFYLGIYALLSFGSLGFVGLLTLYIAMVALKASRTMHQQLLNAICRAPMSYFDTTPIGRILNRFSKDIYTIDETLPDSTYSLLGTAFSVFATIGTIGFVVPAFLAVLPFLAIGYTYVQRYYIATSREVKRWDSVLRSPIYSFFSESLDGVTTIRAYGASRRFTRLNENQLNKQLGAYYISIAANRWLAVRLETIGNILTTSTAFFVVLFYGSDSGSSSSAAKAALAISYSLNITQTLNWTVRMSADMETNLVSVERLNEYIATKPEASDTDPDPSKVPPEGEWPKNGEIEFQNVSARYRAGLEYVIKNVSFKIQPSEKVGVVGQTGSGKSTLTLLILRILEVAEGRILIDGYDTRLFGLERLRQACAIIPQDPVMFQGTLRTNLDPMRSFTDAEIWNALEITNLKKHVESLVGTEDETGTSPKSPLDFVLTEGGSTFSFGQRQLICIARALLRKTRIILLDEATSGIDAVTDELIQDTIRREFSYATVFTIAHRLQTIIDSDKILVMDKGQMAEFDSPQTLLRDSNSKFSKLVQRMKNHGDDEE